jgi:mannose-1-phosphate guanylyltransferase
MKAMILAAGLGTRLRPYSLLRPKPLFPVLGRPLLLLLIDRLRAAGCDEVVVNAHHLREQIVSSLTGLEGIVVQQEEQILGTGGGLRRAASRFGDQPVLVTNGDIYHDLELADVYREHCASEADVTLVLHDCPRYNQVPVAGNGLILGFNGRSGQDAGGGRQLAFTGIHVLDPAVLRAIPENGYYDILDCYRALIRQGKIVRALVVRNHFWTDMGTPEDYLALHAWLLGQKEPAQRFCVDAEADLGASLDLEDWVAIGRGVRIGDGVSLKRVVVWDGAEIAAGSRLADTIVV